MVKVRKELDRVDMWIVRQAWGLLLMVALAGVCGGSGYLVGMVTQNMPDNAVLRYPLWSIPFILGALVFFVSARLWRAQNFVRQRSYKDIEAGVIWLNDHSREGEPTFVIEGLADRSISRADAAAAYDTEVARREESAFRSLEIAVGKLNENWREEGEPPFAIDGLADRSISYKTACSAYYAEIDRLRAQGRFGE